MQCQNYDCTWGAELCDSSSCTNPTLKGPACSVNGESYQRVEQAAPAQNRNYMNIKELTPPPPVGRNIKHTVKWKSQHGHHLNLTYNVLLTEAHIFSLDTEAVLGVTCNNGDIRVQMNTEVDDTTIATLKNSTFITGGSHWGCTFSDGKGQSQHIILRRIKELAVSGNEVKMKTTKASYQEMFESAELSFSTSYLPNATILHAASPDPAHRELFEQQRAMFEAANTKVNQQGRKMLSFWHSLGSFFSKVFYRNYSCLSTITHLTCANRLGMVSKLLHLM